MTTTTTNNRGHFVYVWTFFTRLFHWVVTIAFLACYVTKGKPFWLHKWAGISVFVLVSLRILSGFFGSSYARWSDFIYPPSVVWSYLTSLLRLRPKKRYIGHSPAGGVMVVALILCLFLGSGTGLTMFTLHRLFPSNPRQAASAPASSPSHKILNLEHSPQSIKTEPVAKKASSTIVMPPQKKKKSALKRFHYLIAQVTAALALLHVGGVMLASYAHRENLIKAMITGWKRRKL